MDKELASRREREIAEFAENTQRADAPAVVASLIDGLQQLRDTFFDRIHRDVELAMGTDSLLLPVSTARSVTATNAEIGAYQIAEAAAAVREFQLAADAVWFARWLTPTWLAQSAESSVVAKLVAEYLATSANSRRRTFSTRLVKVFPEASQAPLVIYRLFPLANVLATCVAFRDSTRAAEIRKQQISWLAVIRDCQQCHGRVLENGEQCAQCGNPFWKYDWLTAE